MALRSGWLSLVVTGMLVAALPASDNFKLNSYGFGGGGTADSGSDHYRVNGMVGEVSGQSGSQHFKVKAGEAYEKQAPMATIALYNDSGWYNKLRVVLNPRENPSDAKFAVEISTDSFATAPRYIKSDFTIGNTLEDTDYMTCLMWGVASCGGQGHFMLRGLNRTTVYTARVRAIRGDFTESRGPSASGATTEDPSLKFDIDVSAADEHTEPPYEIDFGNLSPSVVNDSPKRVWVSLETNAESGGTVYISGANAGLKSSDVGHTIPAYEGNLAGQPEGFGVQAASATEASGGPFGKVSPYDGDSDMVGPTGAEIRSVFSASAPVTAGRGSLVLKAKTRVQTPSSDDYTEVVTAIASACF